MNTLTIIAIIVGIPWFIIGWITIVFLLTKSKDRDTYKSDVLELMVQRNQTDAKIALSLAAITGTVRKWKL